MGTPRSAFTLVELLVVVLIISILVGLMLPALILVLDGARSAKCRSNLRQLNAGALAYALDNEDDAVPSRYDLEDPAFPAVSFPELLKPYLSKGDGSSKANVVHTCGAAKKSSIIQWPLTYGANTSLHTFWVKSWGRTIHKIAEAGRSSEIIQFADCAQASGAGTCGGWIDSSDAGDISDPTKADRLMESRTNWTNQLNGNPDVGGYIMRWRHSRGRMTNAVFVDGHVASLPRQFVQYRHFAIAY